MAKLVIRSNIKKALPPEVRVAVGVADALDRAVEELLRKALARAKANKRNTVLPQDI